MTELFAKQVLKAVFWGKGQAVMNDPQHRETVEKAYYMACRYYRSEDAIFYETVRLVKGFYPHISHWC